MGLQYRWSIPHHMVQKGQGVECCKLPYTPWYIEPQIITVREFLISGNSREHRVNVCQVCSCLHHTLSTLATSPDFWVCHSLLSAQTHS